MPKKHDGECVLDVLQGAGLSSAEAFDVALNHTCFPMDCEIASAQARAYLAGRICGGCGVGLPEGGPRCGGSRCYHEDMEVDPPAPGV
jgi:hypothetical protein